MNDRSLHCYGRRQNVFDAVTDFLETHADEKAQRATRTANLEAFRAEEA